jgi:hypothetical protein
VADRGRHRRRRAGLPGGLVAARFLVDPGTGTGALVERLDTLAELLLKGQVPYPLQRGQEHREFALLGLHDLQTLPLDVEERVDEYRQAFIIGGGGTRELAPHLGANAVLGSIELLPLITEMTIGFLEPG